MAQSENISKSTLAEFRELLSSYYEGNTSAVQERKLMELAFYLDMDSIPANLKADVLLLRDLSGLKRDFKNFGNQLKKVASNQKSNTFGRKWLKWSLAGISTAAAVILIVLFVANPLSTTNNVSETGGGPLASVSSEIPKTENSDCETLSGKAEDVSVTPPAAKPPKSTSGAQPKNSAQAVGNFKEIDDLEEVAEILKQILPLLSDNINKASVSVGESAKILTTTIQDAENKLNTLL